MDEYNAASIKILSKTEAGDRFLFERARQIGLLYPSVSVDKIRLGLEVAAMSGAGEAYFIDRYLEGDSEIPECPEFTACYRESIYPRG